MSCPGQRWCLSRRSESLEPPHAGRRRANARSPSSPRAPPTSSGNPSKPARARPPTKLGVEMIWKGPLKEDDRAEQIKVVEQFVTEGVNGIVLAPLDKEALARPVVLGHGTQDPRRHLRLRAERRGAARTSSASSPPTTTRAARWPASSSPSCSAARARSSCSATASARPAPSEREAGFLEAIKANPDITVIGDNRYAGATVATAKAEAMNLIDQLKQADGVFAPTNRPRSACSARSRTTAGRQDEVRRLRRDARRWSRRCRRARFKRWSRRTRRTWATSPCRPA